MEDAAGVRRGRGQGVGVEKNFRGHDPAGAGVGYFFRGHIPAGDGVKIIFRGHNTAGVGVKNNSRGLDPAGVDPDPGKTLVFSAREVHIRPLKLNARFESWYVVVQKLY